MPNKLIVLDLLLIIALGFLGSFGHCVGMCGPIAFMLPVNRSNTIQKFLQVFLYHFGRLLAYSIIGVVFGILGRSFSIFGLQQNLSIGIGIVMILLVIVPYSIFLKYNFSKPVYRGIAKVKNSLGVALKKKTPDTFLSIGFLNGFLPCGLVYMAVFGAIGTGTIIEGSLYMLLFGLGTIPLMTATVYAGNFLTQKTRQYIQKAIPVFVILIGLLFIIRGLGIGVPYLSPKPIVEMVSSDYECH